MKVNGTLEKAQLETTSRTAADDRIPGMVWRDEVDGQAKYDDGTEIKTLSTEDENVGRNAILSGNTDSLHGDTRESDYPNFLRPAGVIRPQDGTRVLGGMLVASPATPLRLRIANEAVEITQNENIVVALPAVSNRDVRLRGLPTETDVFVAPIPQRVGDPDYAYYDIGGRVRKGEVPLVAGGVLNSNETEVIGREVYPSGNPAEFYGLAQCEPAGDRLKNFQRHLFVNNSGRYLGNLEGQTQGRPGLLLNRMEESYNRYYRHRVFVILAADGTPSAEALLGQYTEQEERPDPAPLSNGEIWYRPSTQEYFIRGLTGTTPDWIASKRILIGYLVSAQQRGTTTTPPPEERATTFAAQSLPWTRAYSAENDIEIDFAASGLPGPRVTDGGNISVWGSKFNVRGYHWDTTQTGVADFDSIVDTGIAGGLLSLCITHKGDVEASVLAPAWSDELKCFVIPGRSWRVVGQVVIGAQDVATRRVTISTGINRTRARIWERFALHGITPLDSQITIHRDVVANGGAVESAVLDDATALPNSIRQNLTGGTSTSVRGLVILNFLFGWLTEAPRVELINGVAIEENPTSGQADVIRALVLHTPSEEEDVPLLRFIYVVRALSGTPTATENPTTIVQVLHTLRISRGPTDAAQAELDNSLKVRV